jgi:anthranilate synthase/phosphoribosyltransferase
MMVLIDNYDSFTWNLYQLLRQLTDEEVKVIRNDETDIARLRALNPSHLIISPGPGRPGEAGIIVEAVQEFAGKIPLLGICLGHQAIAEAFGGTVVSARQISHGKAEFLDLDGLGLFRSVASPSAFTRYHSLAVEESSLPDCLEVTARSRDGEIMGIRHREFVLEGLQFHPESIGSAEGRRVLGNFLHYHRQAFSPRTYLSRMINGEHLNRGEAENVMEDLTDGNLTPSQIAGFLVAMNAKGVTPEEIAGCAAVLQRKRTPLTVSGNLLDTCGTGGDGLGTFNISSLTALTAAACGARVAKHGNRAVSSRCGSADFYQALGIRTNLNPEGAARVLEETGFSFLFAPTYHGAMRFAAVPRKELGIKTIMNLLGPLANPAGAGYQLIGVFGEEFCEPVARAAHLLGIRRAMVVHGLDGQDEISVCAPTRLVMLEEDGSISSRIFEPEEAGIRRHDISALAGGDAQENGAIALRILSGKGSEAVRDAAALNAGAALFVYGMVRSISEGTAMALEAFADRRVEAKLKEVVEAGQAAALEQEKADAA